MRGLKRAEREEEEEEGEKTSGDHWNRNLVKRKALILFRSFLSISWSERRGDVVGKGGVGGKQLGKIDMKLALVGGKGDSNQASKCL